MSRQYLTRTALSLSRSPSFPLALSLLLLYSGRIFKYGHKLGTIERPACNPSPLCAIPPIIIYFTRSMPTAETGTDATTTKGWLWCERRTQPQRFPGQGKASRLVCVGGISFQINSPACLATTVAFSVCVYFSLCVRGCVCVCVCIWCTFCSFTAAI